MGLGWREGMEEESRVSCVWSSDCASNGFMTNG